VTVKAYVLYYSRFGNTRRVAETIAEILADAGEAQAAPIDELTTAELHAADLVVFGSPTHYQNLPKEVSAVLDTLSKRALRGKQVAAFDTSVKTWGPLMWMTAAHRLLPKLRTLGGKKLAPPETFLVARGEDPNSGERRDTLCEGELERARAWVGSILERVAARRALPA
jgi:flavodoxin